MVGNQATPPLRSLGRACFLFVCIPVNFRSIHRAHRLVSLTSFTTSQMNPRYPLRTRYGEELQRVMEDVFDTGWVTVLTQIVMGYRFFMWGDEVLVPADVTKNMRPLMACKFHISQWGTYTISENAGDYQRERVLSVDRVARASRLPAMGYWELRDLTSDPDYTVIVPPDTGIAFNLGSLRLSVVVAIGTYCTADGTVEAQNRAIGEFTGGGTDEVLLKQIMSFISNTKYDTTDLQQRVTACYTDMCTGTARSEFECLKGMDTEPFRQMYARLRNAGHSVEFSAAMGFVRHRIDCARRGYGATLAETALDTWSECRAEWEGRKPTSPIAVSS